VVVDKAIVPDVANLRLLAIVGDVIACDQLESLLRTGRPALLVGLGGGEPNISEAIFALRTGDERLVGRACRTIHERLIRGLWRLLGTSEDRECLFEPQAEMFEALLAGVCARDPAAIDEMEASLTDQCPIPPEPCPEPSDFPKEPEPA
jgi:hypothetical protein